MGSPLTYHAMNVAFSCVCLKGRVRACVRCAFSLTMRFAMKSSSVLYVLSRPTVYSQLRTYMDYRWSRRSRVPDRSPTMSSVNAANVVSLPCCPPHVDRRQQAPDRDACAPIKGASCTAACIHVLAVQRPLASHVFLQALLLSYSWKGRTDPLRVCAGWGAVRRRESAQGEVGQA